MPSMRPSLSVVIYTHDFSSNYLIKGTVAYMIACVGER